MKEVEHTLAGIKPYLLISADLRMGQDGELEHFSYMEVDLVSGHPRFHPVSPEDRSMCGLSSDRTNDGFSIRDF
eukprot:12912930-Prorocentrum_lima.AAC.1